MIFKIRFINYRKEFGNKLPLDGWLPSFNKYWMGDIWLLVWRGFGIELDKRQNWIADMINPNREKH